MLEQMEVQVALYYTNPLSFDYPNLWLTCIFETVLTVPVMQDYHLEKHIYFSKKKTKTLLLKSEKPCKYIFLCEMLQGHEAGTYCSESYSSLTCHFGKKLMLQGQNFVPCS